jgi:hypothetical protein
VHGVDQTEALFNAAFFDCLIHLCSDVDAGGGSLAKGDARRGVEPEFFAQGFHFCLLIYKS